VRLSRAGTQTVNGGFTAAGIGRAGVKALEPGRRGTLFPPGQTRRVTAPVSIE
jgi:hypothetical protein